MIKYEVVGIVKCLCPLESKFLKSMIRVFCATERHGQMEVDRALIKKINTRLREFFAFTHGRSIPIYQLASSH